MIPIFSEPSLVILESLTFTQTVYVFDFDGTLAKIVRDPETARMSSTTENLLKTLSSLAPVAIISGRSIEDLTKRVPFKPRFLVGNHGIEGVGGGQVKESLLKKSEKLCKSWKNRIDALKLANGIEVEDKSFSISIHFRKSRNKTFARTQIKKLVESLHPVPHIIHGKCVVNLVPTNAPHKGTALLKLMETINFKHAFYIGDDDTDEDIFSLPYEKGQIMSVRVGRKMKSNANYYIDRQSEINRLLKILIRFHKSRIVTSEKEKRQ